MLFSVIGFQFDHRRLACSNCTGHFRDARLSGRLFVVEAKLGRKTLLQGKCNAYPFLCDEQARLPSVGGQGEREGVACLGEMVLGEIRCRKR